MPLAIRNFCIIAHIDHGKSTLADRMLLKTGAVSERQFRDQMLDTMDLERERGITIKAKAVTLRYEHEGRPCELNLVDTPGHVDFSYEVSRSLAACEGALLLVDASQGVEAQTVANAHLAVQSGLEVIPVLNKIDLQHARIDETAEEIESTLALPAEDVLAVSAKTGEGVDEVLAALVERIPPPTGEAAGALRALVFDATYDDYRGVVLYIRVLSGTLNTRDDIRLLRAGTSHEAQEVGQFTPEMTKRDSLAAGQIGYLITGVKSLKEVRVGETIAHAPAPGRGKVEVEPLAGYHEAKPMVFCGLYPANNTDFEALRKAIERLSLNDSAFVYGPESSAALGPGFRCGFLGLLHMDIAQERLERESEMDLVKTAPNVTFQVRLRSAGRKGAAAPVGKTEGGTEGETEGGTEGATQGEVVEVHSPAELPDMSKVEAILEPLIRIQIILPAEFIGNAMKLAEDRRGKYVRTEYMSSSSSAKRAILSYELPMLEMVTDFYDRLKSVTRGYASLDYEFAGFREADLVKLNILVNGQPVDALSVICHRSVADRRGRALIRRLKKEIPRHLFQVPLQAAIGGRIVARENIPPLRKNVTAKCYGGDVTRKRKLLERQKEGKKRMKTIGQVNVPQDAFLAVLRAAEEDD